MTAASPLPRHSDRLLALWKELDEFPEYPHPAEGEATDTDLAEEQEKWRVRFYDLDRRIQNAVNAD